MGLREIRKSRKLTQKELSQRSGVNFRSLQDYEQGHKKLTSASGDILLRLSKVLSEILESDILVISKKGKVLGIKNRSDISVIKEMIAPEVGGFIDKMLNERLLGVLSTKENVNLATFGM